MTLQRRVLGYLALAAVASCALTVGVAVLLVRHRVASQRMSRLEGQADVVAAAGGAPGALLPGDHVYSVGTGRPRLLGPVRATAVLAAIPTSGNAQGSVDVDGHALLYAARTTDSGRIVLLRSAALPFSEWRPFLGSLALAGLGGVLLASVLSYLLARRLTRPIGALSTATRQVAAGEPGIVVPADGDDELAALGRAFNEMSSGLESARQSQRQFLESVSHELKTPLTSIRGYAEALEEQAVSPSEAARVIGVEADRLERLVSDLLDLARLGRAGFSMAHESVDLSTVVQQAVERHRQRAREMSVRLMSSATEGAVAIGDGERILQATSNLIENALRLTPAGGSVELRAAPGVISVRDSGPGLDAGDIPHAFERFYLHDRYRSERPVGTGLGLAIVKELVAAMGGSVEASTGTDGAEFRLRLPVPSDGLR
jgi:two-component system sensor histidine kinase BaeS